MKYQEIISKLTLEEKVALTSGKDFWQTVDVDREGVKVPSIFLSDGPHGIRKQAAAADHLGLNASIPATCFPTAATMANSWNDELGEEMGKMLGEEAVDEKVNVLLGPGTNMKRNPRCGRNFEYFAEDPLLAGKMAAAYVRGIQSNGISACVKHFALNNQEERRMVLDTIVDERTMREIYLTAFEIAVKEGGAWAIMSSYNMINGTHANENLHLMRDILRDEWGYKNLVVTDWAGCNDRVQGLIAGNELEMPSCLYSNDDLYKAVTEGYDIPPELTPDRPGDQYDRIMAALKGGKLDEKYLDECLDRLLDLIFTTEKAFEGRDENAPLRVKNVEAHHEMAKKCAEECIVLLRNENNLLPLEKGTKVAVIGDFAKVPRYQGAGSSVVNPTKLDSPLACLGFAIEKDPKNPLPSPKDRVGAPGNNAYDLDVIGYEPGFDRYGAKKKSLIGRAVELAKKADVALVYAGLDEVTEAEGLDRKDIKIPKPQLDLIDALCAEGIKTVVILSCGSAVELPFADKVDAIVHAYLGGQAIANAVLDVIVGNVNPSGRLAESYPYKYEDCSSASHFPGKQVSVEYREGPFVGYRYYDTAGVKVRYPFGFGLTYTTFEYSDLAVTDKGVKLTVKNTGNRDGAEVVQLYVGLPSSKLIRPAKELKGFKKVFVKAGHSVSVEIPFDERTFRYFNVGTDKWEVEGGEYSIMIGANVEDIRLSAKLAVKGTTDVNPYEGVDLPSYFSGKAADVGIEEFKALLGCGLAKYHYPVPSPRFKFYKRKRMVIHYNCTVADLRYSKRWFGRLFSGAIRFLRSFMWKVGNRTLSNTLEMGVVHQPIRGMAKFAGMNRARMDGLIMMCNGKFFKGLGQLRRGKTKAEIKAEKQAKKNSKAAFKAEDDINKDAE